MRGCGGPQGATTQFHGLYEGDHVNVTVPAGAADSAAMRSEAASTAPAPAKDCTGLGAWAVLARLLRRPCQGNVSSRAGGVCATRRLQDQAAPTAKRQRFPPESSGHVVWRYCRCALRDRDMVGLLAARGVLLTDETVRRWDHTCGPVDATTVRRRRPKPGDTWHRDAVFSAIDGVRHARWRGAVGLCGDG